MSQLKGHISQVIGPVVDVYFEGKNIDEGLLLPRIHDALTIKRDDGRTLIVEVQQHIGEDTVRTVAMDSTDGLRRGMEVIPTGQPITMPIGDQIKGRLMNVVGEAVDGMKELDKNGAYPIHREPPKFEELSTSQEVLFTGIKVIDLLEPYCNQPPKKNCGTGTTMVAYDWDGIPYPCHLFVPITHGRSEAVDELKEVDFFDDKRFLDDSCNGCKLQRVCKTCYGFNYRDRGDVRKRDFRVCKMMLVEAQVISAFQINYLMALRKERELNTFELTALQGAVRCYELYKDFSFDEDTLIV